jgi:hypothetical protein
MDGTPYPARKELAARAAEPAEPRPADGPAHPLLALQHAIGNQATGRLLREAATGDRDLDAAAHSLARISGGDPVALLETVRFYAEGLGVSAAAMRDLGRDLEAAAKLSGRGQMERLLKIPPARMEACWGLVSDWEHTALRPLHLAVRVVRDHRIETGDLATALDELRVDMPAFLEALGPDSAMVDALAHLGTQQLAHLLTWVVAGAQGDARLRRRYSALLLRRLMAENEDVAKAIVHRMNDVEYDQLHEGLWELDGKHEYPRAIRLFGEFRLQIEGQATAGN